MRLPVVALLSTSSALVHATANDDQLLEWVLKEGGYWNPKQKLGYDDSGIQGVFATEAIKADEVLAQIPWSVVIAGGGGTSDNHDRFQSCDTVRLLKQELDKGHTSNYSPYTTALKETAQVHQSLLPAYWSPKGKELLRIILNGTLPPTDMFMDKFEWKKKCELIDEVATLLVMTHGEDFGMIPVTDRYNSRGGNYTGAYFTKEADTSDTLAVEVSAWRDLEPGEQIYYYYDYDQAGTPELLRDYGFVDVYPQKYIFLEQHIAFTIDYDDENNLEVTWLDSNNKMYYMHPHRTPMVHVANALTFLEQEHQRLKQDACPSVKSTINSTTTATRTNQEGPTEHELSTAFHFCQAMMEAIEAALLDVGQLPSEGHLEHDHGKDEGRDEL
jgi:hypothetical protein